MNCRQMRLAAAMQWSLRVQKCRLNSEKTMVQKWTYSLDRHKGIAKWSRQ